MHEGRCIAVSQRVVEVADYGELRDCLDQAWTLWVNSLGFECVPVPNQCSSLQRFLGSVRPVGIVLSGGNNLAFNAYVDGLRPVCDAFESRDRTEGALVAFALEGGVPLLGCCRGMQFLHAYFGGKLSSSEEGHVACDHDVLLTAEPFQQLAGRACVQVNSFHRFGVETGSLAEPLVPFAVSAKDNSVEGCFHPDLPLVGIMWHPERRSPTATFDRELASRLFACGDRAEGRGVWDVRGQNRGKDHP
jgi:N5-(cytidine 5'-diphosphoramidyl)-L-glutamine hydrolase